MFDDRREDNLKEKLAEERREKAVYAKKAGHGWEVDDTLGTRMVISALERASGQTTS